LLLLLLLLLLLPMLLLFSRFFDDSFSILAVNRKRVAHFGFEGICQLISVLLGDSLTVNLSLPHDGENANQDQHQSPTTTTTTTTTTNNHHGLVTGSVAMRRKEGGAKPSPHHRALALALDIVKLLALFANGGTILLVVEF
jgi:hypothetical protein